MNDNFTLAQPIDEHPEYPLCVCYYNTDDKKIAGRRAEFKERPIKLSRGVNDGVIWVPADLMERFLGS